jgi:DNA-binding CsgD family transcriptional regulator
MTVEQLYSDWMDLIAQLLAAPRDTDFPRDPVAIFLRDTFGGVEVSWNWRDADGSFGFSLLDPRDGFPTEEQVDFWARGGLDSHPLLRWFALSGDPAPMTVGRVPRHLVPPECFGMLREHLEPHGFEQQLSIPYRLGSVQHRAFVLAKPREDFSDDELLLARRIQPMLALLERQRALLRRRPEPMSTAGLTGRELAVLGLLAQGCTAEAIAGRLGISPRTVHKHLEHLYRKLGVRDRLGAVLVATEAAVLPATQLARSKEGDRPPACDARSGVGTRLGPRGIRLGQR